VNLLSSWRQTARRIFRIPNLRPEQESAMLAVLNGRDALVGLPTGFGKSLIYQVPAMIVDQPTIVISPLNCPHGGSGKRSEAARRPCNCPSQPVARGRTTDGA
jgi:hypothetical protein